MGLIRKLGAALLLAVPLIAAAQPFPSKPVSPYGLVGPKGMPPQVVKVLHDAFRAASDDPENMKILQRLDQAHWNQSSEDYARWAAQTLKAERATIERVGLLAK